MVEERDGGAGPDYLSFNTDRWNKINMTYKEAKLQKKSKSHLIGTIDKNEFAISQIIIVPTEKAKQESFVQSFVLNSEISILPFINEDVQLTMNISQKPPRQWSNWPSYKLCLTNFSNDFKTVSYT